MNLEYIPMPTQNNGFSGSLKRFRVDGHLQTSGLSQK